MAELKDLPLFIEKLRSNLNKPLPGETAHRTMEALSATYLSAKPTQQTRKSAVLILLYPFENEIYVPMILRTSFGRVHSGEVAFPGGRYELTDENLICTALREAQEEIGLTIDDVTILGTLTELFIAPSDFLVLPVVGCVPYKPDFIPNAQEVREIFDVKLAHFSDTKIVHSSEIPIPGEQVLTPYYEMEGHKVWGATAKMITELLAVLDGDIAGATSCRDNISG